MGRLNSGPADEKLNHFNEAARPGGAKKLYCSLARHIRKRRYDMTKPIHPRVVGPDGKPKRIRRARAEMALARINAKINAEMEAALPAIEAALARFTPEQIRRAERTLWRWSHPRY
jgi:hypothetical protein